MKCFGFCKNFMNEKSFGPCKNLMKKALDFCKSVMTSSRTLLWTSVQKAFMKTCFGFFCKNFMHRVKSRFGIFLQKTSGGEAVLDFLQKLQVKLAWDFFAKDFMI